MDKNEWYTDRILWRANQHNLLEKSCNLYTDLPEKSKLIIEEIITEEFHPVIVFWESKKVWTVLGARSIYSLYKGNFVKIKLDEIEKIVELYIPEGVAGRDAKKSSNLILLGPLKLRIWAPAGQELMALMSILLMFPLKVNL